MTLIDRLAAAIDAKEAKAQAATPGPWTACQQYEDGPVGVDVVPSDRTGAYVVCPDVNAGMIAEDAEHIADNDPATVLRMCQAHRKIVERHHADDRSGWRGPGDYGSIDPACAECGSTDLAVPWPCPTLLDLAAGYDLTEEDDRG